jgi:hypothetical protein
VGRKRFKHKEEPAIASVETYRMRLAGQGQPPALRMTTQQALDAVERWLAPGGAAVTQAHVAGTFVGYECPRFRLAELLEVEEGPYRRLLWLFEGRSRPCRMFRVTGQQYRAGSSLYGLVSEIVEGSGLTPGQFQSLGLAELVGEEFTVTLESGDYEVIAPCPYAEWADLLERWEPRFASGLHIATLDRLHNTALSREWRSRFAPDPKPGMAELTLRVRETGRTEAGKG